VGRMDLEPGVHEVEQSRCVDHVSRHPVSLTGPVRAQFPNRPDVTQAGLRRPAKLPRAIFIDIARSSSHRKQANRTLLITADWQ
jgi:hypothetical protein